ncbi:integrase catalytic domain-containing protein [Trichonephila clavipes]|uniref:Integrase catalytic domain-containing protein n=1 Tax=Trichonephila clavipes TaxID=2585209 RepID=A0A8X6RTW2_TRICX|nr:integrase catalytic domain-containing protein [Trichonephila clavipes]
MAAMGALSEPLPYRYNCNDDYDTAVSSGTQEKAFQIKSVPDELKAEILLNILRERVNNLLTYVSQEDLSNYVKIKELILKEFEPTPQECLSNFKKARKLPSENYVQFASRLSATFDYYCQLRKVNEFRSLLKECRSEKNCFCLRPHNSLIHFSRDKMRNPTPTSNLNLDAPTLLPGQIEGSVEANSQSQFVATGACAEKLQLKMEKINTVVSCVNDASMVVKNWFVPLADDKFNIPDRIDMLLGAEIFYELLKPGKFYCDNSHLVLQNTVFVYVVSGSVDQVTENRVHCGLIVDDDLKKTLKKFWEIEGVHIQPKVDTEVSLCEDHFVRTHRRNCEGRYVVSMALNKDPSYLGNSKDIAIRRLNSLWKRLSSDSSYLSLYAEFLKEYEELGHLERVVESSEPPTHYYIPHHGVLRPEKLTTKLRIVFNGSSSTTTGISLNDILLKGEVKEDVFETISRFRRHKFAFTTDIQKMYRQILINPDH